MKARKNLLLVQRYQRDAQGQKYFAVRRAAEAKGGRLFNPVNPHLGSPLVLGSVLYVQAPTPHAPPLLWPNSLQRAADFEDSSMRDSLCRSAGRRWR